MPAHSLQASMGWFGLNFPAGRVRGHSLLVFAAAVERALHAHCPMEFYSWCAGSEFKGAAAVHRRRRTEPWASFTVCENPKQSQTPLPHPSCLLPQGCSLPPHRATRHLSGHELAGELYPWAESPTK